MKKYKKALLRLALPSVTAFFGGGLFAFGFPVKSLPSFFLLPVIGMALFLSTLSPFTKSSIKPHFKHELVSFLFFSLGAYLVGYYWVPEMIRIFGDIPVPYNHIVALGLALIICPQFLFFIILWRIVWRINLPNSLFPKTISRRNFLFAIFLTLLELFIPQLFPTHMGHPWLQIAPYIQPAQFFGVGIFSFMSFWFCLAIISFFRKRKIDIWCATSLTLFATFCYVFPINYEPDRSSETKTNNIRMVQANIGNHLKISSEKGDKNSERDIYSRYTDLSTRPSELPIDLIIWPETAYPGLNISENLITNPDTIPLVFREIFGQTGAEIFWGGYDRDIKADLSSNFENEYNTAFFLSGDNPEKILKLKDVYHKMTLIPFGETLPFGPLNEFIGKYIQNISYFKGGTRHTLFRTKNDTLFISAICYEILFTDFIREYLNSVMAQPHFLINLTNDSWYGDTNEPYQHLLARWRAVEFNLPIVRMTNTGISEVIYPDGSESPRLEINEKNKLDLVLKTPPRNSTFYQNYGIRPMLGLWLAIFLLMLFIERPSRPEKKSLF